MGKKWPDMDWDDALRIFGGADEVRTFHAYGLIAYGIGKPDGLPGILCFTHQEGPGLPRQIAVDGTMIPVSSVHTGKAPPESKKVVPTDGIRPGTGIYAVKRCGLQRGRRTRQKGTSFGTLGWVDFDHDHGFQLYTAAHVLNRTRSGRPRHRVVVKSDTKECIGFSRANQLNTEKDLAVINLNHTPQEGAVTQSLPGGPELKEARKIALSDVGTRMNYYSSAEGSVKEAEILAFNATASINFGFGYRLYRNFIVARCRLYRCESGTALFDKENRVVAVASAAMGDFAVFAAIRGKGEIV